jgi:tetratricopeptide (TPR) repeat protein
MAHYNLGNLFIAEQKTEEAIAQYREAIRIKPDFVDVYNNWGIALLKEGKNKEAITRFRKALELKPGYADAQNNLKIARRAAGGQRDTPSGHAWYSTIAFMPGTGKGK